MHIYHALCNNLSAHTIHINLFKKPQNDALSSCQCAVFARLKKKKKKSSK